MLAQTDRKFGIQAGVVLVTGALRVAFGAKGASFYMHNPVFHLKIGLFVLAWTAVRYVSVPAAVAMSAVAAVIPPIAAVVGNSRRER